MHMALCMEIQCVQQGQLLCSTVVELCGPTHLQGLPTEPVQPHLGTVMKTLSFSSYIESSNYDLKATCASRLLQLRIFLP